MSGPYCEQVPDRAAEPPDDWRDADDGEYVEAEPEGDD